MHPGGKLDRAQHEKLADWGERGALVGLASLVVQRLVEGASVLDMSVIGGSIATAFAYFLAYYWLKKSKESL